MKPSILTCFLAFVFLFATAFAFAQQPIPALKSPVTDLTATLSGEERDFLENRLLSFEKLTGGQIAVLIVPTTAPEEIEQFAIRVVDDWKLGRKGVDDGALLLVAKNDRAVRIEVGRGYEGELTDVTSKRIIEEIILPRFRNTDFFSGIKSGVEAIVKVVSGREFPKELSRGRPPAENYLALLMFLGGLIGVFLIPIFGRMMAGIIAGIFTFAVCLVVLPAIFAVLVGLFIFLLVLFGNVPSTSNISRRGRLGGGFGGSGFGGGFRGGGGGFSGGGASGRW